MIAKSAPIFLGVALLAACNEIGVNESENRPTETITNGEFINGPKPLVHGNSASMLNVNNIVGWETHSPITGKVVARSTIVYEYNSEGYPVTALESVVNPLTDAQPGTETWFTEYEYVQ